MVEALIKEETGSGAFGKKQREEEPVVDNELDKSYESMGSSDKDRKNFSFLFS